MVLVVVCKTRKTCQGVAYLVLAGMTRLEIRSQSRFIYYLVLRVEAIWSTKGER